MGSVDLSGSGINRSRKSKGQSMRIAIKLITVLASGVLLVGASPYSSMQDRAIKALSPEKILALKSGGGAGYALSAELNGYPGPKHVLELADKLELSRSQRGKAKQLFKSMKNEVLPLGKNLLAQEAQLELLFRKRQIDENSLIRMTRAIGVLDSKLRATHLKYHLEMADILNPHQRAAYSRLRGYHSGHNHRHAH